MSIIIRQAQLTIEPKVAAADEEVTVTVSFNLKSDFDDLYLAGSAEIDLVGVEISGDNGAISIVRPPRIPPLLDPLDRLRQALAKIFGAAPTSPGSPFDMQIDNWMVSTVKMVGGRSFTFSRTVLRSELDEDKNGADEIAAWIKVGVGPVILQTADGVSLDGPANTGIPEEALIPPPVVAPIFQAEGFTNTVQLA